MRSHEQRLCYLEQAKLTDGGWYLENETIQVLLADTDEAARCDVLPQHFSVSKITGLRRLLSELQYKRMLAAEIAAGQSSIKVVLGSYDSAGHFTPDST